MKNKILLLLCFVVLGILPAKSQLANGMHAPDFTITDINGVSHHLQTYLDQGKTVYLDFFATWCIYCWNYHQSNALKDLYNQHGPNGTLSQDVMVIAIESDPLTTNANINGQGNTKGNWVTGTPYPICNPSTSTIPDAYLVSYYPTIYKICSDGTITQTYQASAAQQYNYVSCCGCKAPCELDVYIQSTTSCNVSWMKMDAVSYQLRYRVYGNTPWTVKNSNYSYANIPIGTGYYQMQVRSKCEDGTWSSFTPLITLYNSMTNNTCSTFYSTTTSQISPTSQRLIWTATQNVPKYRIKYKKSTDATYTITTSLVSAKTLTNLIPNTPYDYYIEAYCNNAWVNLNGNVYSFVTAYQPPTALLTTVSSSIENTIDDFDSDNQQVTRIEKPSFEVMPNPTSDYINIELIEGAWTNMQIINLEGKVLKAIDLEEVGSKIDIGDLPDGLYILQGTTNQSLTVNKRFVKIVR